MNFSNVPSKAEVMGWNPQTLADYMRKVSIKTSLKVKVEIILDPKLINNIVILTIFHNILLVSVLHLYRVITKIQTEINKEERKKATSHK
uniref:Uncharacterized protein n=1 Tax=Neolamprologus brichardi TaxID=32507 RepID=A0A3Q4I1D0_NEOBR